jgi:hypothetical protein
MKEVRPDVPTVLSDVVAQAMSHDREERFIDASAFRRALLSAAERAFAPAARAGRSDAPRGLPPVALAPAAGVPAPQPAAAPAPVPPSASADSRAAWGDFQAPASRPQPEAAKVELAPPQVVAAAAQRLVIEPTSQVAVRDAAMLGDGPFDSIGGGPGGAGLLDLDYGNTPPPPQRGGRIAARSPMQQGVGPPRASATVRSRATPVRAAQRPQAARGFDPFWLVPCFLLALLAVLLFAPALITATGPDVPAAIELEGTNPATAGSTRQLQGMRRHDIGPRSPALRDVVF